MQQLDEILSVKMVSAGECCVCGVLIMMPQNRYRVCMENGSSEHFYCCNGHRQHFTTSEVSRLKEKVNDLDNQITWKNRKLEQEQRRSSAYKGHVTRIKNRIAKGICPCCKRQFQNLARHMAHKHPDYEVS